MANGDFEQAVKESTTCLRTCSVKAAGLTATYHTHGNDKACRFEGLGRWTRNVSVKVR